MASSNLSFESKESFKAHITNLLQTILDTPYEELDYVVLSFGMSKPEATTVESHTLVGGPSDYLFEAVNLIIGESVKADPRFLLKMIQVIKDQALTHMQPQGHA